MSSLPFRPGLLACGLLLSGAMAAAGPAQISLKAAPAGGLDSSAARLSRFGGPLPASTLHDADNAAAQEPNRPTSQPYKGDLSIFDYPDRDRKLQIDRVMDILGITPNKIVADIGAGSGWFTERAARRVGNGGRVFAEDINPQAIDHIADRMKKADIENVRAILGTADDPRLPKDAIDAVMFLKVYHEVARPEELMKAVKASLHPGAKVGIIDRNGNGADHGLNQAVVVREMDEAGFRLAEHYDFTKADGQDYFLVFVAK